MTKTTGAKILMAAVLAAAGCGMSEGEGTAPSSTLAAANEGEPAAAPAIPAAPAAPAVVHASVKLGAEHVLRFVEFQPGLIGVEEEGRNGLDTPQATPELRRLPWPDLYRHFAGPTASIPEGMNAAHLRYLSKTITPTSKAPPELDVQNTGDGPHFYNNEEQAWFRETFCNGSQLCIQGFEFTDMVTNRKIGAGSAVGMVGVEGTANASFTSMWWKCVWTLFYGTECWWIELQTSVIVPGHWLGTSLDGKDHFIRWRLSGSGRNTQLSSSATF